MDMPRLQDLVQRSAAYLSERGIANARRESEWIFAETLALTRLDLYTQFDRPIAEAEVARLRALVARRGRREPLAYVLGTQDFHGLRLVVGPGVLVPRPETEELVELALAALPPQPSRIVDIGTGSGAIALAVKRARPDCAVLGIERSPAALAIAQDNARRCALDIELHAGDLAQGIDGPFAAVIANLPYIAEDERALCDPELAFEPGEALFAGADGLDVIRRLIADAPRLLGDDGVLWLEHGFRQSAAIAACAVATGLQCTALRDGAGHERFARITR